MNAFSDATNGTTEDAHEHIGLSYVDSCDGPVLLLIHGFPLSNHLWDGQIDELGDIARVIAPDLRGAGESDVPEGPYTMAMFADDCVELLDSLGIEQAIVGGLSMGGYVAFEIYRRHPDRVQGLILCATRAGADGDAARAKRDADAARVAAEGTDFLVAGMLDKILAPATYEEDPELVEIVREIMSGATATGVVGSLSAMRDRADSTALLASIDVPTLILHGAEDRIIPPSEAEAMHAAIDGSKLVILPEAGHLLNMEQEEAFNDAVAEFVAKL